MKTRTDGLYNIGDGLDISNGAGTRHDNSFDKASGGLK